MKVMRQRKYSLDFLASFFKSFPDSVTAMVSLQYKSAFGQIYIGEKLKNLHWLPSMWALKTDMADMWIHLAVATSRRRMVDSSRIGLLLIDVMER